MRAAHYWGKTPSEFYREPRWSRAAMVETYRKEGAINYWQVEDNKDA